MELEKIDKVEGKGIPLKGNDIDTDRIMPARYLRCVTFDGIEEHVFEDDKSQLSEKGSTHPFMDTRFNGAAVLIVNRNFGCGSSREHAPQGLMKWGIKGMIAESFGEIFFGNCVTLGIPCLTGSTDVVNVIQDAVQTDPSLSLTLDIGNSCALLREKSYHLTIPKGAQYQFLEGTWDARAVLMSHVEEVKQTAASLPYIDNFVTSS